MKRDTIAAIATGMGNAGIGIVRMSGLHAFQIIDNIFVGKNGKKIADCKSHTIHYGQIVDEGEVIDEVLVMVMKGPHSYTAENTVEINCHGGMLVIRKILDTVIKHGARAAEPGEFTKRAFLNGRIDLSQAEAVIDVINAKNQFALKSSISQLKGSIKEKIKRMRERVLYEIAFIESALDDPEHISIDGYGNKLNTVVEYLIREIDELLKYADDGKLLKEGIRTVIVGKPNAGKSSLMNVLAGEEKAIVTEIAGTTRDVLEESILIFGIQLNIIDTAGIRNTEDIVEKIGVDRAKKYVNEADLVLYIVDTSVDLDENDYEIIEMIQDKKGIVLLNKSDLDTKVSVSDLKQKLDKTMIMISTKDKEKEQEGIFKLEEEIKKLFFHGALSFNDEVYLTNARQKGEILNCRESLLLVKNSILDNMPEDFYSIDLMSAYESLGNVIGEAIDDDLADEIFKKFCMGK